MAILVLGARAVRRRARPGKTRPSVREVCLLGLAPEPAGDDFPWRSGQQVQWCGRSYRVASIQAPLRGVPGPVHYVHLEPGHMERNVDETLDAKAAVTPIRGR